MTEGWVWVAVFRIQSDAYQFRKYSREALSPRMTKYIVPDADIPADISPNCLLFSREYTKEVARGEPDYKRYLP